MDKLIDKLILVHYIDVGNMDNDMLSEFIEEVTNKLTFEEEEMVFPYFIPIRGESRVECINPKLVSEEDYSHAKEVLDNTQEALKAFLNEKNK
tara:strand:- start:39335 stop:39613 length:279 start_codon:yes stop_codon:yes gene_type:complete